MGGDGATSGAAWVPCGCGEWWCRIHGMHAHDCECPPIEEWEVDPYLTGGPSEGKEKQTDVGEIEMAPTFHPPLAEQKSMAQKAYEFFQNGGQRVEVVNVFPPEVLDALKEDET